MKYLIYKQKRVGYVDGSVFYTKREPHTIFRKFRSVNISEEVLKRAELLGAELVSIGLRRNGEWKSYTRSIAEIRSFRTYRHGDDLQYVVPIDDLVNKQQGYVVLPLERWLSGAEAKS